MRKLLEKEDTAREWNEKRKGGKIDYDRWREQRRRVNQYWITAENRMKRSEKKRLTMGGESVDTVDVSKVKQGCEK